MRAANQVKKLGMQLSMYVEGGPETFDCLVEEYMKIQRELLEIALEYDGTHNTTPQEFTKTLYEIRDSAYYAAVMDLLEMLGWHEPIKKAKELQLPEHVIIRRWAK